jgi:hypothetical protein
MSSVIFAPRGEVTGDAIDRCVAAGNELEQIGRELGSNGEAVDPDMTANTAQQCRRSARAIRDLVTRARHAIDECLASAAMFEALAIMGEELPMYEPGHEPWAEQRAEDAPS